VLASAYCEKYMGGSGLACGINCTGKDWELRSKLLIVSRSQSEPLNNLSNLKAFVLDDSWEFKLIKGVCLCFQMFAHNQLKGEIPLSLVNIKTYKCKSFAIQYLYPLG
jgi:hypothetical protein